MARPLLLLLLLGACQRPSPVAQDRAAIAALAPACAAIEAAVGRGELPGAVLLVGRRDRVLLRRAFGRRALEPAPEAMTADTVFDLASLTKVVATATSVMKLVERGQVDLDAPVAAYLPGFAAHGKGAISVRDLLLHRGGLIPDNPLADYADGPAAAWRAILALAPEHPAGERFVYTDVGYIVLAELVRAVDGRPLDVFARAEVFAPLGMADTGFGADPERCAPTERDAAGRWLRGVVHDPRARALGGVAGHAGLFSTAEDLARWCGMILDGGGALLAPASVAEMTRPSWLPDGSGGRALGFDVDTGYSSARGDLFPRGASFGHTGFTGTSLWIDPGSGLYVVLLSNRVHPDGSGGVVALRRAVATAVAQALRPEPAEGALRTGADVLAAEACARLAGRRVGVITNHTGRTRDGRSTVDVLHAAADVELVAIFTPEHGYRAELEGEVASGRDPATGLPVHSLYGETRRPTAEMLAGLDTLVFDVQDAGVRFYTYATTLGYTMEAAAEHGLRVVVLDRPNPLGGERVAGPRADPDRLSFIAYRPIPVVHGMTMGELATLYVREYGVACDLEVVRLTGWRRDMAWEDTGLEWLAPSPNLRTPTQARLYPMVGLLEGANLSVGRGTDEPFERFGAPWIDAPRLAAALEGAGIDGVRFSPLTFTPAASRFAGEACHGVRVTLTDPAALRPVEAALTIAWHLERLFEGVFEACAADARMLNRRAWEALMNTDDPRRVPAVWTEDLAAFRAARARCLLYD